MYLPGEYVGTFSLTSTWKYHLKFHVLCSASLLIGIGESCQRQSVLSLSSLVVSGARYAEKATGVVGQ